MGGWEGREGQGGRVGRREGGREGGRGGGERERGGGRGGGRGEGMMVRWAPLHISIGAGTSCFRGQK